MFCVQKQTKTTIITPKSGVNNTVFYLISGKVTGKKKESFLVHKDKDLGDNVNTLEAIGSGLERVLASAREV